MNLIALAIPFFLLALLVELAFDRARGTGVYRANDAVSSLGAGTLSTTLGYFTRLVPAAIFGYVMQHFALVDVDAAWFDFAPRGIALWALALVAFDFCYYWAHRMGHEISVLWASHAVHHQSEDYNLSTALRQTSTGFLFTWVFYLPLFLLGMPFEVFLTVNALDLIYQFWVHTQLVGKLGWLDRIFVTPSNHRVHHAQNPLYIDRNYGGILIIWDRLFGTFQEECDSEPVVYGVRKPLASWNPFWANLQVYNDLWFDAKHTCRWRDKFGIWFHRTGWRPADVAVRFPKRSSDPATLCKYDPPLGLAAQRYIILQFVAAAITVLWIGMLFAEAGAAAVVVPCLALWTTLYSLGMISEGRLYATRFELIRLLLVVPLAMLAGERLGTIGADRLMPLLAGVLVYIAVSLFMLLRIQHPGPTAELAVREAEQR